MKFPRNARIFRGQLDAAPFATVFFLLVIFLMLGSLVYTPGVRLNLPTGENLPGTDRPSVAVAMDANGRLYYENRLIEPDQLKQRLAEVVKQANTPLSLLVQADRSVSYERLLRLSLLAREAGIADAWLATLPRPFELPRKTPAR
ncbi:MAG TPA: biopolymer transporter ExbD [Verrucomicrobiota bacterium]|nr:biopolymer transporter ExbD [Verrucomicrobiota bacterium]HRT56036.1 biopolymer transporter ExbD [Candidatus Paceibacterota bacterium]